MELPIAQSKHLLTLTSVEDDGLGEELQVVWEIEPGAKVIEKVALQGSARDPHTDKQIEEKWCSELDLLTKYVAGRGGEIRVAKAVAAGTAPLKVVSRDELDGERLEHQLKDRRLK